MSGSARVFVSYRREDTRHVAGRLADRLVERFQVFMDMDTIEPGTDFTDVIRRAVNDCDVFLSVIGTQWTTVEDERGQRRLDDPNDWVVAETAAALQRNAPVIPVLVDGARMPARSERPDALASLSSRQGMTLRHESFSADVGRLIAAIDKRVRATATTAPGSGQRPVAVNPPRSRPTTRPDWPHSLRNAGIRRSTSSNGCSASNLIIRPRPTGSRRPAATAADDLEFSGRQGRGRGPVVRRGRAPGEYSLARPRLPRSEPATAGGSTATPRRPLHDGGPSRGCRSGQ